MSDREDFLSRWSRLKRESASADALPLAESAGGSLPADVLGAAASGADALPVADGQFAPPFDPASLPSIESIVAGSDIRQFLHADVPEPLTRAALRSAWSADPAIRDFVGIADNQWDFNEPSTIPGFGFGPLEPGDYARSLVERALRSDGVEGSPDNAEGAAGNPDGGARAGAPGVAPEPAEVVEVSQPVAEVTHRPQGVRPHGAALPR